VNLFDGSRAGKSFILPSLWIGSGMKGAIDSFISKILILNGSQGEALPHSWARDCRSLP